MSTVLPPNMAKNNKKRAAVSQAPEADSSKPGDKPTVSDSALTLTEHAIRAETNEAAKTIVANRERILAEWNKRYSAKSEPKK